MTTSRSRWTALHGLVRLSLGAALLVHEGMVRERAQWDVLVAGLGLLTLPDAVRFDRWMGRLRALAASEAAATEDEEPTR